MKHTVIVLLALILFTNSYGQGKQEREVARKVEEFSKAVLDGDSIRLAQLTDDALSYGHSAGRLENQREFVSSLASGRSDFKTLEISNQTVTIKANTAIVRHRMQAEIVDNGNAASPNLGVIMVWIRNKKEWKLLARQAVRLQ